MEQYVVIRDIEQDGEKPIKVGKRLSARKAKKLPLRFQPHMLRINGDIFVDAFNSFSYANWLKELGTAIDDEGSLLFPGLGKSPETLLMYLRDLGLTTPELLKGMTSFNGNYHQFLRLAGEFGKMLIVH